MSHFIHDGLTERAYLAPIPRLTGELRFEYRPTSIEALHRFLDGLRGKSLVALGKSEAAAVAERVVSWSLLDSEGDDLPITAANLLALRPSLFRRLKDIVVYGTEGGDADPLEPHDAAIEALLADAAATGRSVAELREERDTKN